MPRTHTAPMPTHVGTFTASATDNLLLSAKVSPYWRSFRVSRCNNRSSSSTGYCCCIKWAATDTFLTSAALSYSSCHCCCQ